MKIAIDDLNINYIIKGSGKPILILEGWQTNLKVYDKLTNHLSKYRKVYALDLPGFGESDEPKFSWTLNDYVSLVIKFIKKFDLEDFDILAHSFGGRIVIKSFPNNLKINKIIMISPAGIKNKKNYLKKIREFLYKFIKRFPKLKEFYVSKYSSIDYKNASPIMRKILVNVVNEDLTNNLSYINKPCLLIWGDNDKDSPLKNGYKMNKIIKDSGLCIIPNSGHFSFLEKEAYVYKIIDTFLEENEK